MPFLLQMVTENSHSLGSVGNESQITESNQTEVSTSTEKVNYIQSNN